MEAIEFLSVLDKLIDHEPDKKSEPQKTQYQIFQEVKVGIRRDLENLLNTKIDWTPVPQNCEQLKVSLVDYGLPDFTSTNLSAKQNRHQFVEIIEAAIEKYETRFEKVEVVLSDDTDEVERSLRFTIRALLKGDLFSEIVAYSTRVDPVNRTLYLDTER